MFSNFILLSLVFFSTEPRDRLGRTSLKLPILHRVGRKTVLSSVLESGAPLVLIFFYFSKPLFGELNICIGMQTVQITLLRRTPASSP